VFNLAALILSRRFAVKDREFDYREWYRRTLFEKRLTTVQEAYRWLMRLYRAASQSETQTVGSEANRALLALSEQARNWHDANCVFLEDAVPKSSSYIGALNSVGTPLFFKMYIDAERDLRERLNALLESEQKRKQGKQRSNGD
jgi:hypothetical protein